MIDAISLQGFKSFAERTRLEFAGGVCAIIGPNGSGKSNVIEAIRWVTHSAKARELRAGRGTELIFHGSGSKAPLGMAEIELELRTPQGRLYLARRVYRDGTFEQDLNGKAVRAKDIQAALLGTGLGLGGLAVIGQGEVGSVVQAEGKTLLGYLQEAAGLSRVVSLREETAARLSEADNHLSQLSLILSEHEQVVTRLGEARQAAQRHQLLSLQRASLEESIERHKYLELLSEIAKAIREQSDIQGRSEALSVHLVTIAEQLEAAKQQAEEARQRLQTFQGALETLQAAQEAYAQAARYQEHLQREQQRLKQEWQTLPTSPPTQEPPPLEKLQADLENTRLEAGRAEQQAILLEKVLQTSRKTAADILRHQVKQEASLGTLKAEYESAKLQQEALSVERENLSHEREILIKRRSETQQTLAEITNRHAQMQTSEQEMRVQLGQWAASLSPLRREKDRLEAALLSYSRYGEGARNALRLQHDGIVGSVADLLDVPAEYETAVTAALGRRLEQVVVERADDARELIEELKTRGGRATFLPLELLKPRHRATHWLGERGVLGYLCELCPTDPSVVGETLFGDTLLMNDLAVATSFAKRHATRPRVVTLGGDLLESGGAMTGGRLKDMGGNVLTDQRRFQDLQEEIDRLGQQEADITAKLEVLNRDLAQVVQELAQAQKADREAGKLLDETERRYAEKQTQWQSTTDHVQRLSAQISAISAQAELLTESPTTKAPVQATDLAQQEADWQRAREQATHWRAAERKQLEQLAAAQELSHAWRQFRQAEQRRSALAEQLALGETSLQAQEQQLLATKAEVSRREEALGELDQDEYTKAKKHTETLETEYRHQLQQQNTLRQKLAELSVWIARREGSLPEAPPMGCVLAGTAKDWMVQAAQIRQEMSALEPINARAEIDYAEQLGILAEQREGYTDSLEATQTLREHLVQLQEQERTATLEAWQRVSAAFSEYSSELLGGEGALEPEYHEGILVGLRLAVQPKGKKTRSMTLLSAGERTMAGLGFLFALNHARDGLGLPLAVLDEVDAPLDEANIRRFTAFLQRFGERGTQFILVTHQKATMEAASALWGVTTEQGVSRVLSIKQRGE